jgi:hypothetical protein
MSVTEHTALMEAYGEAMRRAALEEAASLVNHILFAGGGTYGDKIKELLK